MVSSEGDRKPIAFFVVLAFALSWIGMITANVLFSAWGQGGSGPWRQYALSMSSTWGPATAAFVVTYHLGGWSAIRRLLSKLSPLLSHAAWYILFPVVGAGLTVTAVGLAGGIADAQAIIGILPSDVLPHFAMQVLVVGIGEELGWRGWLLPTLAANRAMLRATVITGAVWLAWHLPKFLQPLAVTIPLLVIIASSAIILSYLWLRFRGDVLLLAVAHVSINSPIYAAEWSGVVSQSGLLRSWAILGVLYAVIGMVVLATQWNRWTRKERLAG